MRLASPTTAAIVGGLSLVFIFATIPLEALVPGTASPAGSANVVVGVAWFVFGLSFTGVGVVLARRQPRNPMGWFLLGAALAIDLGSDAPAYQAAGAWPVGQFHAVARFSQVSAHAKPRCRPSCHYVLSAGACTVTDPMLTERDYL